MFNPSSGFREPSQASIIPLSSDKKDNQFEKKNEHRSVFCCKQTMFYRPTTTKHEDLFSSFIKFDKVGNPPELSIVDPKNRTNLGGNLSYTPGSEEGVKDGEVKAQISHGRVQGKSRTRSM